MTTGIEESPGSSLRRLALDSARTGDIAILGALLADGTPVNLRDEKGNSLLMLAVYHGHTGTAALLLRSGADPDSRNSRGQTPLGAAAFKGWLDLARLLIGHGADPIADQGGDRLPAHFAALFGHTGMVRYLESLHPAGQGSRLLHLSKIAALVRGVVRRLGVRKFYIPHAA